MATFLALRCWYALAKNEEKTGALDKSAGCQLPMVQKLVRWYGKLLDGGNLWAALRVTTLLVWILVVLDRAQIQHEN